MLKTIIRKTCKGWGANLGGEIRRKKIEISEKIQQLEEKADQTGLSEEEWKQRCHLEEELEKIHTDEEWVLRKRSGEQWLLKGDVNTGYFHSIANGRKRNYRIDSLEDGDTVITDKEQLQKHIEDYYKSLFGREESNNIELDPDTWRDKGSLTEEEQQSLIAPFTLEEVETTLKEMKSNTTPGLDGLSVEFYNAFWDQLKRYFRETFNKLYRNELNLNRLNYGLISLIPKLKEANHIKQCRPICLLGGELQDFYKSQDK